MNFCSRSFGGKTSGRVAKSPLFSLARTQGTTSSYNWMKRERELRNVREFQRAANREMKNESDMVNFSLFTCGHQQTPLLRSLIYLL